VASVVKIFWEVSLVPAGQEVRKNKNMSVFVLFLLKSVLLAWYNTHIVRPGRGGEAAFA
jgi:hypothetical protein